MLGLESRNGFSVMKVNRVDWADVQNVPPGLRFECEIRSGCQERLDMVWEDPVV